MGWKYFKLTPEAFKLHSLESIKSKITSSTVMFNYHSSGTYNYIAAAGVSLSKDWKAFFGQIGGEGFNSHNLFRPGTRYVKILMLTNYSPENETGPLDEVIYRNIKFKVEEDLTPSFVTVF